MENLTRVFSAKTLEGLKDFSTRTEKLGILERCPLPDADEFFKKMMKAPFNISGKVHKETALKNIQNILKDTLSTELQNNPFYEKWLSDMATISQSFCNIQGTKAVRFWLGTKRGCRRYHIDNVPLRMLVT